MTFVDFTIAVESRKRAISDAVGTKRFSLNGNQQVKLWSDSIRKRRIFRTCLEEGAYVEFFIIFTERVQAANNIPRVRLTLASNRQFSRTEITAKPFAPYLYTPYVDIASYFDALSSRLVLTLFQPLKYATEGVMNCTSQWDFKS